MSGDGLSCDSNPTRVRRAGNETAFHQTMRLYVRMKFQSPVISSWATIDDNLNSRTPRWTPTTAICAADIELAAERALDHDCTLLDSFWSAFVLPTADALDDVPVQPRTAAEARIVQRCGAEFRRRKLWPIRQYFNGAA
jgi:hypothetical protein